jgi:DNA-binding NarL/FixJ family response regulator
VKKVLVLQQILGAARLGACMPTTEPTVRLVLADDSDAMRQAIRKLLLSKAPDIVVEEASNGFELWLAVCAYKPDVVLMDAHMLKHPEEAEAGKFLLRDANLLAMSVWTDEETAKIAKSYGAIKLLDKADLDRTLISAIEECTRKMACKL